MLIRCGIKLRLLGGRRFSNIGPFIYPGTLPSPERLKPWQNEAIRACVNAINTGRTKIGMHIHGDSFLSLLPDLLDRIKPSPHVQQRKPEVLVVAANINRATKIATTIAQSRREWLVEVDTAQDKTASEATVLVTTYAFAVEDCYRHHRLLKRIDVSALKTIVLTDVEIFEDEPWVVEPRVHPPRLQQVYFDDFSSRFLAKPRWLALFQKYSPVVIATTTEGAVDLNTIRRLGPIEVVYRRTLLDSLVGKWECNPRFLAVPVRLDLQGISARKKLSKAMRSPEILHATVEAWLSNAAGIRKTTLVYCVDDAHASELEKLFRASNIDARQHKQTNGQPDKKYDEIMDEWSAGNFPVLIVSHSETVWVSRIDCLVLATAPTKNSEVYENRLLSAMRASPDTGKEDSLVIELLDTSESPQTDSYDIRALLQLDAAEISGQPLDVLQARAAQLAEFALPMQLEKREQARLSRTPTQGVPISIMRYPAAAYRVRIQEEERDKAFGIINDFSPLFNWVYCRSGVYVHDCFGAGHALISRKEGHFHDEYEAHFEHKPLAGPVWYGPPSRIISPSETAVEIVLQRVLDFVIQHALLKKPGYRTDYREYKAWDIQLIRLWELYLPTKMHLMRKYRGGRMDEVSTEEFFEWLTVGDASNALARLTYMKNKNHPIVFSYAEQRSIMERINLGERPPNSWFKYYAK